MKEKSVSSCNEQPLHTNWCPNIIIKYRYTNLPFRPLTHKDMSVWTVQKPVDLQDASNMQSLLKTLLLKKSKYLLMPSQ
jgi:hypothetical protein